jgi:hypothetical protein
LGPFGTQNGSCVVPLEILRSLLSNDIKFCMNRSSDGKVMAPGSRGVRAVFLRFSYEDSGQTGDVTGELRVACRSHGVAVFLKVLNLRINS